MKVVYLSVFNNTGNNVFFLSLLSIFIDSATRTITRILILVVCMGYSRRRRVSCRLGVCKASLGDEACKFIFFGVAYFIVSLWDSYCGMYPSNQTTVEMIRLFVTSG